MSSEFKTKLSQIWGRIGKLKEATPGMSTGFFDMIAASQKSTVLDAKTRELIAIAVTVTTRCDDCIAIHIKSARDAGATREEVAAALSTAIELNTGAAYSYSARALDAFDQC